MKRGQWILPAAIAAFLLWPKKGAAPPPAGVPRGLRNNNPGNIIVSGIPWKNKIPYELNQDGYFTAQGQYIIEKKFEQFSGLQWGTRAMILNLLSYFDEGLNTITKIVTSWSATDQAAYITAVSNCMNRAPDSPMQPTFENLRKLVQCMSNFENGVAQAVPTDVFSEAYQLAFT